MAPHPARPQEEQPHPSRPKGTSDSDIVGKLDPGCSGSANGNSTATSVSFTHCRFEDLLQTFHEFALVLDPHGKIEAMWSSNANLTDQVNAALLGRRIEDVLDAETFARHGKWPGRSTGNDRQQEVEYSVQLADGLHWFVLRVMPVAHVSGRLTASCVFARDVSLRKRIHVALYKSEVLLRKAEEIGKMGCWEMNLETGEGIWSEELCAMFGLRPGDSAMTKERFLALIHPDDRERVAGIPAASPWNGGVPPHEARLVRPDGRIRTFYTRAVPIADATGRMTQLLGLCEDITERKEVQERLQRSEMLLAQAEQLANLGSWEYDVASKALTWSAQFYRMLGFDPENAPIPSVQSARMIHPEDLARARSDLEELETTGKPLENELRFVTQDGKVRIFHSRALAIVDESGRVIGVRGMSQDITERKREEDRVRKSEALLAQAEHIANLGSWEFDLKAEKTTLSKSLLRLYGIDCAAEFTRDWYWEQVHPEDRRRARILANRGWRNCKPFAYMVRFHRPNSRTRVHFVRGIPIPGPKGQSVGSIGVVQDITDQRRVVQDLRRLSQQVMHTRDQERRQTARDLHESAGQSLAALKMTLGQLKGAMGQDTEKAREIWKSAVELTDAAVREVRTVSYLMHPPLLDEAGLGPALRWYATGFTDRSGINVAVEVDDHLGRQSQEIETTVFRVVQESLTNVHRYSGSRRAWIRVMRTNGKIRAEVRDEGRGLAVASPASTKSAPLGVGIAGMRERVEQLGGTLELESARGRGTTVRATLPLMKRTEETMVDSDESEGRDANQQRRKAKRAGA
jgi:PAS domain S-box-containing protein